MVDEVVAAAEVTAVETTIPNTTPIEPVMAPTVQDITPEAYKDAAWVKDVKDIEGLFKMTGDMKSELGKRADVAPAAPDSVDGYELSAPQEGGEDFQKGIREIFLKAGVSAEMAKALDLGYNELVAGLVPNQEAIDAEFDKMTTELFGDRAEEALKNTKALLAENTPESMVDNVNNLGNKELTIMAAVLDNVTQKYINEDSLPRDNGSLPNTMSNEEIRSEVKKLLVLPGANSKSHEAHDSIQAKIAKLYDGLKV